MIKIIESRDSRIPKGTYLVSINGQKIDDELEFKFYNDITTTRKFLFKIKNEKKAIIFKPLQKLAVQFEPIKYRQCENHCSFCFIKALPKGLRKELYFRDDDYRLSFLFGNYLSLTNITKSDIKRIDRLRLSPLYISVHTTDPVLRKKIFNNERAGLIMEQLNALIHNNIKLHCQIVLIPGINDGKQLFNTINNLSKLCPGVSSIGIVPVGVGKLLKDIQPISKKLCKQIIRLGEIFHNTFRARYGKGIVYLADEFYLKAEYPIPPRIYYDDFPQIENGIGMSRAFLDELNALTKIKKITKQVLLLTGRMALPLLIKLKQRLNNARVDVMAVDNQVFGKKVTVSGLICGCDFLHKIKNIKAKYDLIVLPPNCVNENGNFIDDRTIDDKRVMIAPDTLRELVQCLQS